MEASSAWAQQGRPGARQQGGNTTAKIRQCGCGWGGTELCGPGHSAVPHVRGARRRQWPRHNGWQRAKEGNGCKNRQARRLADRQVGKRAGEGCAGAHPTGWCHTGRGRACNRESAAANHRSPAHTNRGGTIMEGSDRGGGQRAQRTSRQAGRQAGWLGWQAWAERAGRECTHAHGRWFGINVRPARARAHPARPPPTRQPQQRQHQVSGSLPTHGAGTGMAK